VRLRHAVFKKSVNYFWGHMKHAGLCNSSAVGEKANDLIVSERQKHNGMSWTKKGTVALATITALAQNNEYRKWFEEKDIEFKLAA
jgi:hypothetical protein